MVGLVKAKVMNEYIPSDLRLRNKDGIISLTRGKQSTPTTVRSKLASRKVIFEDPFCLNDNCPTTDQPATDIRVGHQNIENEIFNKTVEGTENINYDKESFDLKEQVQDLSTQLEEICKYARSSLNENDDCFCHELVGGKCLLPQNQGYSTSPRLKTPPEVWVSKPDCCQSCTVPCRVKSGVPKSETSVDTSEKKQSFYDDDQLQDHMNDIKRRLSLIQNNYANKVLPPTSSKAERDIDEHLEKINQQNISHRQFHALPQTQTSGHRSNTMKSVMNQKLLPGQRSKKSNIKSKLSDRQLESSQRNNSFLKQKQVISSNSKLKTTDSISKPKNQLELTNMRPKSSTNIIGDISMILKLPSTNYKVIWEILTSF
ncbi:unnamed protein product [Heterobilharzia americana]|nr:unnamed protein product [Heterobilharzia americana]